jgi:uncharacterized membrane protein HdeD (DUF308 family)
MAQRAGVLARLPSSPDIAGMINSFIPYSRGQAKLRGALALVLGIVFVVWPGITIGTAVVLFAVYCFIDAFTQLSSVFADGESAGHRVWRFFLGLLDIAAAAVAIIYPGPTAGALVWVIGIWMIVGGVAEISGAFTFSSGWLGLTGVLSIVAGVLLVAWPGIGAVTLAIVFGVYLAVYGVMLLTAGIAAPGRESAGEAAV